MTKSVRADKFWDKRSPQEYRGNQLRLLKRYLREQVLPFSPYYRKLFEESGLHAGSFKSLSDLEKLPLTCKADIAPTADDPRKPRNIVLQPNAELIREHWPLSKKLPLLWKKTIRGAEAVQDSLAREYRPVSVFFTTGRSALPTAFTLSQYDLGILKESGRRIAEVADIDHNEDKIISLFPYAPHLAFWQVFYVGLGGNIFTLNTGGGKVMGTEGILQAIQKMQPAYLAGIPGYVYHLLREAHSQGLDLGYIKGLALGGDAVTPGYRERVKELLRGLGATDPCVLSVLGFTESRKCWIECRAEAEGGFHLYPDLEIVEIVDPDTGKQLGEGETGELVYTCLDGRGSTILRYRTGDIIVGGMTWEKCPGCGRTVQRMSSHLERVSNMKDFQLSKVKGTLVNLNLFKEELDNDERVEEWQLVIKKKDDDPYGVDEIHLNLALASQCAGEDKGKITESIGNRLRLATEVSLNDIHLISLERILELLGMETQLKEKRIVDLRSDGGKANEEAVKG